MTEWIDARDVFEFINERRPSTTGRVSDDLLRYLRAGSISARASAAITQSHFGKSHQEDDCEVDSSVWDKWGGSNAVLSLSSARFTNKDVGSYAFVELIGLSFSLAELKKAFAIDSARKVDTLQSPSSKSGAKADTDRWAEFAAALAYVANTQGVDMYKSKAKLYEAVSDYLSKRGLISMDEKVFRRALDLARLWVEQGDDPDNWPGG